MTSKTPTPTNYEPAPTPTVEEPAPTSGPDFRPPRPPAEQVPPFRMGESGAVADEPAAQKE